MGRHTPGIECLQSLIDFHVNEFGCAGATSDRPSGANNLDLDGTAQAGAAPAIVFTPPAITHAFEPPETPRVFLEGANTITGHRAPAAARPMPDICITNAIRSALGREGKRISEADAHDFVAGDVEDRPLPRTRHPRRGQLARAQAQPENSREIAVAMGVAGVAALSLGEAREAAVAAVRSRSADVGIPARLRDVGVRGEDIPALAAAALADVCTGGNPRDTTVAEIDALYRSIL